jgi:hypothetical protein
MQIAIYTKVIPVTEVSLDRDTNRDIEKVADRDRATPEVAFAWIGRIFINFLRLEEIETCTLEIARSMILSPDHR